MKVETPYIFYVGVNLIILTIVLLYQFGIFGIIKQLLYQVGII